VSAFIGKAGVQPGPSRTMVMLLIPNERLPPRQVKAVAILKLQPISPHFEMRAASPITVAVESPGSVLKTADRGSPPFERLISEAQAQNGKFLQQYCAQEVRQATGTDPSGTVVMMIRVEADGHVSDSKVEESGGAPGTDQVVQSCIGEVGVFEAHHKGDETVPSWQRIHWAWTGS